MYCSKCGKKLFDNENFCKNCENQLDSNSKLNTVTTESQKATNIIASIISIIVIIISICVLFNINIKEIFKRTDDRESFETELKAYVRANYTGYNINGVKVTRYQVIEKVDKNEIYRVEVQFYSTNALGRFFNHTDTIYVMFKNNKAVSWFKPNYALKDTYDSWKQDNGW